MEIWRGWARLEGVVQPTDTHQAALRQSPKGEARPRNFLIY
jgi:hypothetical protein